MATRREFLEAAAVLGAAFPAGLVSAGAEPAGERKRLAVITTEWRYRSHAWHMAERFLVGYPSEGRWHKPPWEVVSAYVDQRPEGDLSRKRAREFGFALYDSISQALCRGGSELAVDAVLIIGEHGKYPLSEFEQTKYPRYEFFKQVTDVFRRAGRTTPVFNDKHLSWNWDWALEMVEISRELKAPFLAGSSLPVTWRLPAVDMPHGAEIEELLCVAMGRKDSYDFHALEVIQCMAERRRGGETGVTAVQALQGEAVWRLLAADNWQAGGLDPGLFSACLARSQTLAQGESYSHRFPSAEQMREWVKEPLAYRIEYADGLKATMLLMNGLVNDFTFAARLKGRREPLSTLFYLPPLPNVAYSAPLMARAEELFTTGVAPYPIERTLLTTGLVEAGVRSLGSGEKRLKTPHLAIKYQAPKESLFARS